MEISVDEARGFNLACQYLMRGHGLRSTSGTLQAIEQLGYVQLDTISVVQRAHHHVLWSRIGSYQPVHLQKLEQDRQIFEYWAHAAAYLPISDYRFTLIHKHEIEKGPGHWYRKEKEAMRYLLERIRQEGPLRSRDVEKWEEKSGPVAARSGKTAIPEKEMDKSWAGDPIKRAFRQLFMEGKIMVAGREGFQKVYDLTERVLPASVDTRMPSRSEYLHHLIHRHIRAHGLVQAKQITYLRPASVAEVDGEIKNEIKDGRLLPVTVRELPGESFYTDPDHWAHFTQLNEQAKSVLLSPFDNLIIQRDRTEKLFDFKYTLECYVPASKRQFGYFSLPLLSGTRFIAQLDIKAERNLRQMVVRNLAWESRIRRPATHFSTLDRVVRNFARFNECDRVVWNADLHIPPEIGNP